MDIHCKAGDHRGELHGGDGRDAVVVRSSLAVTVLVGFVRAYQVVLSPLFGDCCRFTPSCSHYMIEALRVHGAIKGAWLGIKRILRCHPFGAKGYDPVPPRV